MLTQHDDDTYGPIAPEALKFYNEMLLAARLQDPAAYLDWEMGLTIPEVVYAGKRLLITYPMREEALKFGRTAADILNGVVTPSVRLAWQREVLTVLTKSAEKEVNGGAATFAFIEKLKAFWLTPQGGAEVPLASAPPPITDVTVPKPEGWDSSYVLKNTPFGQMWMKP